MISRPPNILIIEDNALVLRLLQNHLAKNLNAHIFTAIDREEGLDKLVNEQIDILLLDMFLQNKTTLDFIEKIKNNSAINTVPIVVITVIGDKENIDAARKLGIKDFVVKGETSLKETSLMIKSVLEKKGSEKRGRGLPSNIAAIMCCPLRTSKNMKIS